MYVAGAALCIAPANKAGAWSRRPAASMLLFRDLCGIPILYDARLGFASGEGNFSTFGPGRVRKDGTGQAHSDERALDGVGFLLRPSPQGSGLLPCPRDWTSLSLRIVPLPSPNKAIRRGRERPAIGRFCRLARLAVRRRKTKNGEINRSKRIAKEWN